MDNVTQLLMRGAAGAAGGGTFVDDVFSTYLYSGNSSTLSVNNGVDNTKGGMIWFKARTETERHMIFDTERGTSNYIQSNSNANQATNGVALTSFDNDGYTLGASAYQNNSGRDYTSWNFRKAKGFFDVVTWTGNSDCGGSGAVAQTISHSLGCVPGMIMVKRTDASENWIVYHRGVNGGVNPEDYGVFLNLSNAQTDYIHYWNDTAPTSSSFTAGHQNNICNATYVAYLFAGGASTAATAKSLRFNGSSQSLHMAASTNSLDFASSGQITIEFFVKLDSLTNGSTSANYQTMVGRWQGSTGYSWLIDTNKGDGDVNLYLGDGTTNYYASIHAPNGTISAGQWYHIAIVKNGTTGTIFVNGIPKVSSSSWTQGSTNNSTIVQVANNNSSHNSALDGQISNFRVTNGQALYTAAFKPPTEPLTTTSQGATASNVKILMCQDTNPTVGAVTTGTITNNGSTTASTDSPFDDPAGFKFGEGGDQNIIKTGSYVGNANDVGPEVYLGFEPQFLIVKNSNSSESWHIMDCMRGILTRTGASNSGTGNENKLYANSNTQEIGSNESISLTGTGFNVVNSNNDMNGNNHTMIYIAIRRPDGYVGKPPELGTDVFAMDTGNSSASGPAFDANFAVDFALNREFAGGDSWATTTRLTGRRYVKTNSAEKEDNAHSYYYDDYNNGWAISMPSNYQSWMWKRHIGMDVVTYPGKEFQGRQIPHSLNAVPEMIWVKNRTNVTENWAVYHKGLNGGTNPEQYYLRLNTNDAEIDNTFWYDTAPTSTHFSVGYTHPQTNQDDKDYLAYLFASVDGVSKVGYYAGTGSAVTVTTGFLPRLVIIKRTDSGSNWVLLDSLRGLQTTSDSILRLNDTIPQYGSSDNVQTSSTGFTVPVGPGDFNNGDTAGRWIYYAHA